jgi:hypothetical protein
MSFVLPNSAVRWRAGPTDHHNEATRTLVPGPALGEHFWEDSVTRNGPGNDGIAREPGVPAGDVGGVQEGGEGGGTAPGVSDPVKGRLVVAPPVGDPHVRALCG